jgi:prepilin peptidase dependent protein B
MFLKNKKGFTLVEVMVALLINTVLFAGLLTVFIANLDHHNKMMNISRLDEQLQSAMQMMAGEIRRAGYWSNANSDVATNQNNNPFMASGLDISVPSSSCILFSYDRDKNNSLPSISSSYDDERYGFRLNGGAIQTRPPGAAFDCTAAASAWENLTDTNNITITALTFTLTTQSLPVGSGTASLKVRSVDITVTGQLATDSTVTKTLTEHVRIRNDKFVP